MTNNKNWEKRDIVEVIQEQCPTLELHQAGYGANQYWLGKCPLHDDNNPSFAVYPNSQRFVCYSCHPKAGDVIDFIQELRGVNFIEAREIATTPLDAATFVLRTLTKQKEETIDLLLYAKRCKSLFEHLDIEVVQGVLFEIERVIREKRPMAAELILSRYE